MNKGSLIINLIGGLFITIAIIIFSVNTYKNLKWESINANIEKVELGETQGKDSKNYSRTYYFPKISYTYIFNEQSYQDMTDSTSIHNNNADNIKKLTDQYKAGDNITIKVNPANPNESYFEIEKKANFALIMIIFGIFILSMGYFYSKGN